MYTLQSALEQALFQYYVWAEDIKEWSLNQNDRDTTPYAGYILLKDNGDINYSCFVSNFNINTKIIGYVDCFYIDKNGEYFFIYQLSKDYTVEHNSLVEYCKDWDIKMTIRMLK
jgi:hypothetical protein